MKPIIHTFIIQKYSFTAKIHKDGKEYTATCVEIGTSEWGDTKEEALQNLKECTETHVKAFPDDLK